MKKTIYTILAAAALAGLTACQSEEQSVMTANGNDGRIRFTVVDEAITRGAGGSQDLEAVAFDSTQSGRPLVLSTTVIPRDASAMTRGVRMDNVSALTTFGVSAIKTVSPVSADALNAATPGFFYNEQATKNTNDVFEITEDYYWPSNSEALTFYAYAPYGDDDVVISAQDAAGPQKVTFTVNTTVADQVDLVTANASTTAFQSVTGDVKKAAVPLNFRHELTAIRFNIGEQWLAGSIKSVAIKNVHGKGILTIGTTTWDWSNYTATDNFSLTLDKTGIEGTNGEEFMTGEAFENQYFLMIPQTFEENSGAYLEVKYQDLAKEYTVTASLDGQTWTRGTTVVYNIGSHELTTLKIGTISWPDESAEGAWSGLKNAFANKDSIGLYVVGTNGTDILHQNVKCTYAKVDANDPGTWTIHHPANNIVYKLPDLQYFFYYPYTPTPDTKYPLQGQGNTDTEATAFFSTLIDGWTPAANQSILDSLNAQDLQVGKGLNHATLASTVDAQMAHQMNIGAIILGTKNITSTYNYTTTDGNLTWTHPGEQQAIQASAEFNGNLPYTDNSATPNKHYFVFKPSTTATLIKGMNNNNTADWTQNLLSTERGIYQEHTVTTNWDGNVYYPGSLSISIPSQPASAASAALTPEVSVKITVGETTTTLTKGTDYTFVCNSGSPVTAEGNYTVNITPGGDYSGAVAAKQFTVEAPAYQYVDLGLPSGLLWCDRNVGATSETGNGWYFDWAGTTPHSSSEGFEFSWANTSYYTGNGTTHSWSKYKETTQNRLEFSDDAAHVNIGSSWRMATKDEWQELLDGTDQEWGTINGIYGRKFMKKSNHSVYIFMPAAGYIRSVDLENYGAYGNYWTSSLYENDMNTAWRLPFNEENGGTLYGDYRKNGFSVRAVQGGATTLSALKSLVNAGVNCNGYLGYYVKQDGSISISDASAIGRIGWISSSNVDASLSGTRILVFALTNCGNGSYQWKTSSSVGESTWGSETALDGFDFTTKHDNSTYPAAHITSSYDVGRPSGASRWFLPSRAQFANMYWVMMYSGTGNIRGSYYYTATESTTDTQVAAWCVFPGGYFGQGTNNPPNGRDPDHAITSTMKANYYAIRACFAF